MDVDARLASLEADNRELRETVAALVASHAALRAELDASAGHHVAAVGPAEVVPSAAIGGSDAGPTGSDDADASPTADGRTSRRTLIGGGLAGVAAVATGALLGTEPAAASVGAMQFGANNNAGTSGTNLTSSAVDKTLFLENTGNGQGLRVTSAGPGAAITSAGVGLTLTSTATRGLDVTGKSTAVNAEVTNGIAVRAVADDGFGAIIDGGAGTGVAVTGEIAQLVLEPNSLTRSAPTSDAVAHTVGSVLVDGTGDLWVCVKSGTPGTWRKASGPATAGALHVLAAPVRIYDSRPGTLPNVGPKTKFAANQIRVLDATVNASGVPADATALVVTCLLVNTVAGNGNFTIWANGVAKPSANTMVWGGSAGRFSTLALTKVGAGAKVQVAPSVATDLVVDVVGFYR